MLDDEIEAASQQKDTASTPLRRIILILSTTLADGWRSLVVPARDNNAALDGARSLAVILVIASHVAFEWQESLPDISALRFPFYYFGWSGVDLFFVLSGLLIGGQIWKELERTNRINFKRFWLRRAFRIWPLYFAFLAFLALVQDVYWPDWSDWLLLSNYFPSAYARGWSLSTEEHFYLVAPLLCLLHFRFFSGRRSAIFWLDRNGPYRGSDRAPFHGWSPCP